MFKEKYFEVNVSKYNKKYDFNIYYPSSINDLKNNSVLFINKKNEQSLNLLEKVKQCLIYCDIDINKNSNIEKENCVIYCKNPRWEFCRFFKENNIRNNPTNCKYNIINGACICEGSQIGKNTIIMPMSYIGPNVTIGDNCYIGVGTTIVGNVQIGNNVIIREQTAIGTDGLSTDKDYDGTPLTFVQFGSVIIKDNVEIGSHCTIARGAIDSTIISEHCKIDNNVFVSHNVVLEKNVIIVGESILFGSSYLEQDSYISGNCTVRNKIRVGKGAFVGMGAVVTKDVMCNTTVLGNPAKPRG